MEGDFSKNKSEKKFEFKFLRNLPKDIKSKIIIGALSGSVTQSQAFIPGLEKYSKLDLINQKT